MGVGSGELLLWLLVRWEEQRLEYDLKEWKMEEMRAESI